METKDSVGNVLNDGDTIIVAKTLKVKGRGRCVKKPNEGRGKGLPVEVKVYREAPIKIETFHIWCPGGLKSERSWALRKEAQRRPR